MEDEIEKIIEAAALRLCGRSEGAAFEEACIIIRNVLDDLRKLEHTWLKRMVERGLDHPDSEPEKGHL